MTDPATVTLTVMSGAHGQRRYVYGTRTMCVLGRARDCDPCLPDDGEYTQISRHHCLLDLNPPQARIRDLGSRNGTFVNGRKIGQRRPDEARRDAVTEAYPDHDLADGDEIRIGETVLRVTITGPRPRTPGGPGPREPGPEPREEAERIAGYTVLSELGRGGMGAVYLAEGDSGQRVALKVMLARAASSETSRARFLREIRIGARLDHPNIVAFQGSGHTRDAFYFTSEYCAGGSLADLARHRRLTPAEAVRLTAEALSGLDYAHRLNVVHRDLSPGNILLAVRPGAARPGADSTAALGDVRGLVAKVSDFGLAKAFDEAGLSGLTGKDTVAGKARYVPRQQVLDFKNATPAGDVWAVAACLYEALTGASPRFFPLGKDPWQVVLAEPAIAVRKRDPSVPERLAAVIDQALSERPKIGFQSAAAFRDALLSAGVRLGAGPA